MGLVTGTVQLSLAEVDNLRDQIKDEKAKVKELENELVGVKADKRIMKVTEKVYASKHDYMISFDERLFKSMTNAPFDHSREGYGVWFGHSPRPASFEDKVKAAITLMPIISHSKDFKKEKVEFVNMDDVKQEIRSNIEQKFEEELTSLKSSQRYHQEDITKLKNEHIRAVADLKDVIAEKDQAYADLLADKKVVSEITTLKEVVAKLTEELQEERNKPWYKKLFV